MGVTGVGLFAADVACDVRSAYREAMEDGAEDADAERAVLEAAGFLDTRDREAPVIRFLDYASTDLPDAGTLALIPDRAALTPCVGATRSRQSSRRAGGSLTTSRSWRSSTVGVPFLSPKSHSRRDEANGTTRRVVTCESSSVYAGLRRTPRRRCG